MIRRNEMRASKTRARRRPKIYLADTGLAASLLSLGSEELLDPAERMRGPLLETFVVNELAKQSSFSDEPVALSHFRSTDGRREIDVIAETADGRVFGFEVKAGRVTRRIWRDEQTPNQAPRARRLIRERPSNSGKKPVLPSAALGAATCSLQMQRRSTGLLRGEAA